MHTKFKIYVMIIFFLKLKLKLSISVYKYDDDDDVNFLKNLSIRTELNNKSTNNTCYIVLIMCI